MCSVHTYAFGLVLSPFRPNTGAECEWMLMNLVAVGILPVYQSARGIKPGEKVESIFLIYIFLLAVSVLYWNFYGCYLNYCMFTTVLWNAESHHFYASVSLALGKSKKFIRLFSPTCTGT
jgi:hypothetical protein